MAERKKWLVNLSITVALVALNLIALNYLVAGWSAARIDLTSERLYSISPATKRILTNLDEDLTVYGYFSQRTHPKLQPLIPEIVDLLEEYRAVSRGKVHVEIADPSQDKDVEQEASDRYGVQSTPFRLASKYESAIVNAYFSLVIKYGDQYVRYGFEELIQVEPTPDGDIDVKLRNLEYDLTRAIKKVVYGFRGTHELFERVAAPVKLTAIWTPKTLPEIFSETPAKVRQAAEELKKAGGDKFVLEEIDPTQNEELKQQLYQRFGARPMSLGAFGGEEFYLYAILEQGGRAEQIVLAKESVTAASVREAVESALRRNTPGYLKKVGIATSEPMQYPPEIRMQMQLPPQPPPEYEEVKNQLRQDYQVEDVQLDVEGGVPADVDVLLVLEPKDLAELAVYNLDQYLMRGGRVVLCSGNYDVNFSAQGLHLSPAKSGLEDWLKHYGVTLDKTLVLDDRNQPLPIPEVRQTPFGSLRSWRLAPYPYLVQVREDGFRNREITATLDSVGIYWGSPLTIDKEAVGTLQVIPILQSSDRSWTDDDLSKVLYVNYEVPAQGTEPYLLAAALSGKFKSYFAGKPIPTHGAPQGADKQAAKAVTLEESPETRLVVVGNAEFLSDFVARALAQVDGGFFVENLRFAQNVIDWTSLDNEMLGIRARGLTSRRLERVADATKNVVEWINYLAAALILAVLAAYLQWRRRQVPPLAARTKQVRPATASSGGM